MGAKAITLSQLNDAQACKALMVICKLGSEDGKYYSEEESLLHHNTKAALANAIRILGFKSDLKVFVIANAETKSVLAGLIGDKGKIAKFLENLEEIRCDSSKSFSSRVVTNKFRPKYFAAVHKLADLPLWLVDQSLKMTDEHFLGARGVSELQSYKAALAPEMLQQDAIKWDLLILELKQHFISAERTITLKAVKENGEKKSRIAVVEPAALTQEVQDTVRLAWDRGKRIGISGGSLEQRLGGGGKCVRFDRVWLFDNPVADAEDRSFAHEAGDAPRWPTLAIHPSAGGEASVTLIESGGVHTSDVAVMKRTESWNKGPDQISAARKLPKRRGRVRYFEGGST